MYSNCLLEAIKAKLRHPKTVHILYLPRKWNDGNLHFMWIKDDCIYHYEALKSSAKLFFKGKFKHQSLETFEAVILRHLARTRPKLKKEFVAKRLHFRSVNQPGMLRWETYCPAFEQFNVPKRTKLAKLLMVKSNNTEIKIIKVSDFKKEDYEWAQWKYISPYCQEFNLFDVNQV